MPIMCFLEALYGKFLWNKIKKQYHVTEDDYLLIECGEKELSYAAVEYLPEFLEKKYANRALFIVPHDEFGESTDDRIIFLSMSERKILALLKFYQLERFFDRVIVLSLKEPFGSYGLLKKKGITLEIMVKNYLMI